MPDTAPNANPFALMMDPESVFQAIERSERLSRLKSRICRPLDKTQTPAEEPEVDGGAPEAAELATNFGHED